MWSEICSSHVKPLLRLPSLACGQSSPYSLELDPQSPVFPFLHISLTMLRIESGCPRVRGCYPFDGAPTISCGEVIWKLLLWFHRVDFDRSSVPSYDIMCSSVLLLTSVNSLYSMFSHTYIVLFEIIPD